jgi:hypothetical protein
LYCEVAEFLRQGDRADVVLVVELVRDGCPGPFPRDRAGAERIRAKVPQSFEEERVCRDGLALRFELRRERDVNTRELLERIGREDRRWKS